MLIDRLHPASVAVALIILICARPAAADFDDNSTTAVTAQEQTKTPVASSQSDSLKGIKKVELLVDVIALPYDVDEELIQQATKLATTKLSASGVDVVAPDKNDPSLASMHIVGSYYKTPDGSLMTSADINVWENVSFMRDPDVRMKVMTWRRELKGPAQSKDLVLQELMSLVDSFIRDYQSANKTK